MYPLRFYKSQFFGYSVIEACLLLIGESLKQSIGMISTFMFFFLGRLLISCVPSIARNMASYVGPTRLEL